MLTEESQKVMERGKQRLQQRKQRAATSLDFHPPLPQEMNIIHQLYLSSKQIQEANELAFLHDALPTPTEVSSEVTGEKLVWMKSLVFKNAQLMHAQV